MDRSSIPKFTISVFLLFKVTTYQTIFVTKQNFAFIQNAFRKSYRYSYSENNSKIVDLRLRDAVNWKKIDVCDIKNQNTRTHTLTVDAFKY